jgi:hypothetical protein
MEINFNCSTDMSDWFSISKRFERFKIYRLKKRINQLIGLPENTTEGFVYAASAKTIPTSSNGVGSLPPVMQFLPSLSLTERSVLSYFTHGASRVTCCHANVGALPLDRSNGSLKSHP